ncbi:MAG TPA: methyltransferase domain-containing protein [Gemmataceae bacterium]|nr:methyltransferase domain-containing protein [Gemmataceae bacterium]
MRRCLVEKLACPECRADIQLAEVNDETPIRVMRGKLRCVGCNRTYPIENGVPRLVKVADDVAEVCKRFSFQWLSRWNGMFEGERCYGFDDEVYIGWVRGQLLSRRQPLAGDWMLDAGCGSGEKTAVLARQSPEQNVVGLDLGVASQEKSIARFGDMPNLDYIQGNIMEAPLKERSFDYGMSLGVLHHTNDTRLAFAKFRKMLKDETTCVIWIYPTYWEGPEWRMPYFARDFITFGQGYRMPTSLLRFIAHGIVLGGYPIVQFFFWKSYRRIGRDLPFFEISKMSMKERYWAQVFYCFDTLLPRYQFRHTIKEIEGWMAEEGLDPLLNAHSFYTGSSTPRLTAPMHAEEELAAAAS